MKVSENMIEFIRSHSSDDVNALRLKYASKNSELKDFDIDFALLQIEARKKARLKLPGFVKYPDFVFPTLLSAEQASNEAVAKFHADMIPSTSSLLDITAGLGIDALSFARRGINVTACEIDDNKCKALNHNAKVLDVADRVTVLNTDSTVYLRKIDRKFDLIFADPARRNSSGGKVHAFSDCQPDILSALPDVFKRTSRLLVKSSPLLDLTFIRNTVNDLNHIYVVCFKGECKEVLIDIKKDSAFSGVTVVDLDWNREISRFFTDFNDTSTLSKTRICERQNASDYTYLYEPNAGVMKTGAWSTLVENFPELSKADSNTNIFLSDTYYKDFPGKIMEIVNEPDKREMKNLKGEKINIVSRNHPLSAPQILKKFSLTSGSDRYLYAFKYRNSPTFIISNPVVRK